MRILLSTLFIVILGITPAFSQLEVGLQYLPGFLQTQQLNPAIIPDGNVSIGLTGGTISGYLGGLKYSDIFQKVAEDESVIVASDVLKSLSEKNFFVQDASIETLSASFTIKNKVNIQLGHSLRQYSFIGLPLDLFQLGFEGNANYLDQDMNIAPVINGASYHEFYLGGAYKINDQLTVGARFKYLSGVAAVNTPDIELTQRTESDFYRQTIDANYRIDVTGELDLSIDQTGSFNFDIVDNLRDPFTSNSGFAFDLGVYYTVDKWAVSASATNILGQIKFKGENQTVNNYTYQGQYAVDGIDLVDNILFGSADNLLDSLTSVLDFNESQEDFSMSLPTNIHLNGNYEILPRLRAGVGFQGTIFNKQFLYALSTGISYTVGSALSLSATYAYRYRTFDNLGLQAGISLGPVQILAATDNFINAFRIKDASALNARVGLNLVFGRPRLRPEQSKKGSKGLKRDKDGRIIIDPEQFYDPTLKNKGKSDPVEDMF